MLRIRNMWPRLYRAHISRYSPRLGQLVQEACVNAPRSSLVCLHSLRALSTQPEGRKGRDSFADVLNRLRGDSNEAKEAPEAPSNSADSAPQNNEQPHAPNDEGTTKESAARSNIHQASELIKKHAMNFWEGLQDTARELFEIKKPSQMKQRIIFDEPASSSDKSKSEDKNAESKDDDEDLEGDPNAGTAIVLVKDKRSYWERFTESLKDAPIIQNMRETGRLLSKTELGQKATEVGNKIKDRVSDAREYWETTQNPVVVSAASVWDSITRETDQAVAIRELRRLDPNFSLEKWTDDAIENLFPTLLGAYLRGDTKILRKWLGVALFNKFKAEIQQRKLEQIELDTNLLSVEDPRILNVTYEEMAGGSPIIIIQVMTQQITCVRKQGEIIEGSEDNIQAYFYVAAFQREYNEEDGVLQWKLVDLLLSLKMPYL